MLHTSPWKVFRWGVYLGLLLLHVAPARADTNLAWSPATAADRDAGTWQRAAADTLVLCRTGSQTYDTAPVVAFSGCLTDVFACTADRPVGAGSGCPTAGNYADERFIPRAEVAQIVVAPPVPPRITSYTIDPHFHVIPYTATLAWAADADTCELNTEPVAVQGTLQVQITETGAHHFELQCARAGALAGWQINTYGNPVVPFVPPSPPGCYPYLTPGVVSRTATTIDGGTVEAFGCDKPTGYVWRTVWRKGDLGTAIANCAPLALMAAINEQTIDAAWIACLTQPHTPTTKVVADELTRKWKPRFVVATAASGARPVYARNSDGTRGDRVRLNGVAQSIAAGTPCNGGQRLAGTTSRYNSVSGQVSLTDAMLPASSFALCSMQQPPTTGWPAP